MRSRVRVEKTFCTTREAAEILGVSLRTAQLWTESGLLEAWKTTGGHRRISRQSVEGLLANPTVRETREDAERDGKPRSRKEFSILVVEDEADLRRVYELMLSRWALKPKVTTVGDGYAALVRIGLEKPDMVIADLRMPGMDGFQMIQALRKVPELKDTGIVVVTGLDAGEIDAQGGLSDGIAVLPKPIPFDTLEEMARQLAGNLATGRSSGRRRQG